MPPYQDISLSLPRLESNSDLNRVELQITFILVANQSKTFNVHLSKQMHVLNQQ